MTSLRKTLTVLSICFIAMLTWLVSFTVMAFGVDEPMMDRAYYRKGMDYQKRLDELKRGGEAGWYIETSVKDGRVKAGSERILVYLRNDRKKADRNGISGEQSVLTAILERPASTRNRQSNRIARSRLLADGNRVFELGLRAPAPGYWELLMEVELKDGARVYRRHKFYAGR